MKRLIFLCVFLCALAVPSFAQSASDITVSGTLYNSFNDACTSCTFTVTVTRRDGVAIQSTPRTVTSHASTGAVSFTLPRKSFVTFTGNYTVGRYSWKSGISMFLPDQSTIDIVDIQSVDDAAAALVAVSSAPSDATYWTSSSNSTLSAEVNLGALTSGLLKHTVSGSTSTPATAVAGTDFVSPGAITGAGLTQSTGKLLGRYSASTGAIQEITISTGLSLDGSGNLTASGSGGTWGSITGTLSSQTDLQTALDAKANATVTISAGTGLAGGGNLTTNRTLTLDLAGLVNSQTLWDSSQSSRTLTAGLSGATDPVLTFSDGVVNLSTGALQVGGVAVPTISSTDTLSNKTLTAPTIASFNNANHSHTDSTGGGQLTTSALTGLGTGVATALGVNVGSAGAFVTFNGALGTPSSGTATNLTGLPLSTGVTGDLPFANFVQAGSAGFVGATGAGDYSHRTPTQVTAALDAFVGDSGSGGTKGLVPAPTTGDATKYLKGDGTWGTPSGSSGITIGTTTITSGTNTRVLFNNAGVVGEYAITGTGNVMMSASPTTTGTLAADAATFAGVITQTSASATAFESGPNGATNPVFRLVNNVTSAATGISVTGRAAAAGVDITVLSSGTNESLNIYSKGTGRVNIATATGLNGVLRVTGASSTSNYLEIGSADASNAYITSSGGGFQLQGNSQFLLLGNRMVKFYNGAFNAAIGSDTSGLIEVNSGTLGTWRDLKVRQHYVDQTITAGGTTGDRTINKSAGTVNLAAAATSVTVTSSLVSTSSTVYAMARTNDSTCSVKNVVPGSGSFVINMTAACTAETSVGFLIINF